MTGPADSLGIIAGSGSLPREVAESVIARGGSVHVVMVDGAADASLAMFPHTVVNGRSPVWRRRHCGRPVCAMSSASVHISAESAHGPARSSRSFIFPACGGC